MANTSKRGFASMEGEKQRIIASKGGKAAHAKGTAHEWSSDEARAAGRKGGESRGTRGRSDGLPENNGTLTHYSEHALTTNFLTNAGRSLRAPGATGGVNGQPLSNITNNNESGVSYPARTATAHMSGAHLEAA